MTDHPSRPVPGAPDFGRANGWLDASLEVFESHDLPSYVGPASFRSSPGSRTLPSSRHAAPTRPSSGRRSTTRSATVPAPASARAPSGRRSTRPGRSTASSCGRGRPHGRPLDVLTVVDAGDANIVPACLERGHAMIFRKVREVAATGAIPFVLGGDHSITWPSASAVAEVRAPGSIGIVHFDAHADTANEDWGVLAGHGTPMRRLIESGAVEGKQLRPGRAARLLAAGRDVRVDAGAGPALALHARDRGARRRGGHRRGDRRGARRPRLRST